MSIPRMILFGSIALFVVIGTVAIVKKSRKMPEAAIAKVEKKESFKQYSSEPLKKTATNKEGIYTISSSLPATPVLSINKPGAQSEDFPYVDRIYQLFTLGSTKLPIVETVTYTSSVPWLKGRPAWLADYAAHYATSRHFIARSLNGKPDYFSQKVSSGSRFNVFRKDKKFQFHLLVDLSRCKMGLYYIDLDTNERVHLKTYRVGVGKIAPEKVSGCLTPVGTYSLGNKVAIYKPGMMGMFQDKKVEMIRIFGTRWIPFGQELGTCSAPARGYGFRGAPWSEDAKTGQIVENREGIGKYESDGCVYLSQEDIEELFAIVITKPSVVEIVKDFHEAKLPGIEVATPKR